MSQYEETTMVFKAFCDPQRLRILELLRTGEMCGCKLLEELPVSQSTLSHHMKILMEAKVIQPRKEGRWVYYSFDLQGSVKAMHLLEETLMLNDDYMTKCKCD